jgi:hypothetical protein
VEQYRRLIKKAEPSLGNGNLKIMATGLFSLAVIADDKYVFRFPLEREEGKWYLGEKKFLDKIAPLIHSAQIPAVTLYDVDGIIFTKHRLIEGETYSAVKGEKKCSPELKQNLAAGLAKFCAELHSVGAESFDLEQFTVERYDVEKKFNILAEFFNNRREIILDILNAIDFIKNYRHVDEKLNVLCHNDLNENNIIVDVENQKLAGVIDFCNGIRRNFNIEFAPMAKYDFGLTRLMAEEYQKLTGRTVDLGYVVSAQKIRCYGGIIHFLENKNEKLLRLFTKFSRYLKRIKIG